MEMQIEEEWSRTFETIKSKHDLAYRTIEMAIRNEEEEQPEVAMVNYKLGISLIDDALNVQVAVPDDPSELDESWGEACKMIHKMKRTRGEVLQRLTTLGQKYHLPSPITDSCDATVVPMDNGSTMRPRTYFELSEELRKIRVRDTKSIDMMELLLSCEGVKLFYISDTGSVTTSSEDSVIDPSELQAIENESVANNNDVSWVYPPYPGTSPCFRTDFGAYDELQQMWFPEIW